MTTIKTKELRKKSKKELEETLTNARNELMVLQSKVKSGLVPDNPSKIKETKKLIARILTILNEGKNMKELV